VSTPNANGAPTWQDKLWDQSYGPVEKTGATAGTPGTWSGSGTVPASVAALQAAIPAIVATPATAWTTGQYVQTLTAGVPGQAHWSGSAWVTGPA